jgi:hypothetical protein
MDFYEDEQFERVMEEITDKMGYLILDVILMSLKKINRETQIFKEILEAKLESYMENYPDL